MSSWYTCTSETYLCCLIVQADNSAAVDAATPVRIGELWCSVRHLSIVLVVTTVFFQFLKGRGGWIAVVV